MDGISVISKTTIHNPPPLHIRIIRWFYFIIILILYYNIYYKYNNIDKLRYNNIGFSVEG